MTLVITDGEFWWSWRELNPRPKFLHNIYIIVKIDIYVLNQLISLILCLAVLCDFKVLPPICRQFYSVGLSIFLYSNSISILLSSL